MDEVYDTVTVLLSAEHRNLPEVRSSKAAIQQLLDEAKHVILVVMYSFDDHALALRLAERARHGIAVEVHLEDSQIVEAESAAARGFNPREAYLERRLDVLHTLERSGALVHRVVHAKKFHQIHTKCLVVDRKAAIIGSGNFTEAAVQGRSLEAGLLLRGPSVGVFRDALSYALQARDVED